LRRCGIIPDFYAPNVICLAPVPLSTTYHGLWRTGEALRDITTPANVGG
jgi:kynureninase